MKKEVIVVATLCLYCRYGRKLYVRCIGRDIASLHDRRIKQNYFLSF